MSKKVLNLDGANLDIMDITLCQALDKWGADYQLTVAIEECSEIIKAICKIKRAGFVPKDRLNNEPVCAKMNIQGSKYYYELIDEIADGYVVLRELVLMYNCDAEVQLKINEKLQRLMGRIVTKDNI